MTTLHTHGLCSRTKLAWALLEGALPVRRTVPRLTSEEGARERRLEDLKFDIFEEVACHASRLRVVVDVRVELLDAPAVFQEPRGQSRSALLVVKPAVFKVAVPVE